MNTEKITLNKLKLLTIFLLFILIVGILGLVTEVKSANNYSVESIQGSYTWKSTNVPDLDKNLLKTLYNVVNYDEKKIIKQENPASLKIGESLGGTSTMSTSLNWSGCIGCTSRDYAGHKWTTMMCIEPDSNISSSAATDKISVLSVVFVSPDQIVGYNQNGSKSKKFSTEEAKEVQKLLKQSYLAQDDVDEAVNFRTKKAYQVLNNEYIYNKLGNSYWKKCDDLWDKSFNLPKVDENKSYYSIFVLIGKSGSGQDRVIWKTIEENDIESTPVELEFIKTDENGNKIDPDKYGKATFKITGLSGTTIGSKKLASVSKTSNEFTLKVYPANNTNNQFKIKLQETSTPENYIGLPSGGVILTVTYNSNGKITRNESWNIK